MPILTKKQIAQHALDRGIKMFFDGEPALLVQYLVFPALLILRDLAQKDLPNNHAMHRVWKSAVAAGEVVSPDGKVMTSFRDFMDFLSEDSNAAKHADRDPDAIIYFSEDSFIAQLTLAAVLAQELGCMTVTQLVYCTWEIARENNPNNPLTEAAKKEFPGLGQASPAERLAAGREAISDITPSYAEPSRFPPEFGSEVRATLAATVVTPRGCRT